MDRKYKYEDWHDMNVSGVAQDLFSDKNNTLDYSLFDVINDPNATFFEVGEVYIGTRRCKNEFAYTSDYLDYEETVVVYIENVDKEHHQVDCFKVYYELSAIDKKTNKRIYAGKKEYPPYTRKMVYHKLEVIDNVETIIYMSELYEDYDVLNDKDDVPILVSAQNKASLKGWWNKEVREKAKEETKDSQHKDFFF